MNAFMLAPSYIFIMKLLGVKENIEWGVNFILFNIPVVFGIDDGQGDVEREPLPGREQFFPAL